MEQIQIKAVVRRPVEEDDDLVWDPILRKYVFRDILAEPAWRSFS